jgi:dienelactone hydrolase
MERAEPGGAAAAVRTPRDERASSSLVVAGPQQSSPRGELTPILRCRLQTEDFDVLVIGGGCVGAGTAWEAATRGLKVALVERSDFAAGAWVRGMPCGA